MALVLIPGVTHAYPFLFASRFASACTSHPGQAHMGGRGGGHLSPEPDPAIKFSVTTLAGKASPRLCPGASHVVQVLLPSPRYGLLTSSAGEFREGDPWDCPNRVLLDQALSASQSATLELPCEGTPPMAFVKVTTAEGVGRHFKWASTALTIDPGCAAVKCKTQLLRLPTNTSA